MKSSSFLLACSASAFALIAAPAVAEEKPHHKKPHERQHAHTGAKDAELSMIIVSGQRDKKSYAVKSGVGSKVKEDPRDIPQSIAVISRQRMEDQNIRTSSEALSQIPGFNATNPEGFYTLRGFSTSTSVDGAPSGAIAGRTDVDVEVLEQIEVLKGASALLQGNGDPGGVVNYVFKKPTNKFKANAKLGGGSYNAFYVGGDVGGPITADKSLRFRTVAFYEDRDLFTRPEYRKRLSLYGTLQYDITDRTTASIGYHRQSSHSNEGFRQGLPAYTDGGLLNISPRTSYSQDWWRWDKISTSMLADIEHRFGGDWIAKVAWRRGRAELPSVVSYPGSAGPTTACAGAVPEAGAFLSNAMQGRGYEGVLRGLPYGGLRCFNTQYYNDKTGTNSLDAFISGSFKVFGAKQKLLFGYNRREDLFSRAPFVPSNPADDYVNDVFNPNPHVRNRVEVPIPKNPGYTKTRDEGIYSRLTISPVKWLKIPIGARFAWVTDAAGNRTASGKVIPYFGIIADITPEISLYTSYVESFTPASATARIWNGDPAGGRVVPPVTGDQIEGGVKGAFFGGRLTASADYYHIKRKNTTSADPDPSHQSGGQFSWVQLTGTSETQGFEAQVDGEIVSNWSIGASYAYTDAKITKDDAMNSRGMRTGYQGQRIAMVPKHAFNMFTNYHVRSGRLTGLSFGGGIRAQSMQYGTLVCASDLLGTHTAACPPRIKGPGYTTISLRVGYSFTRYLNLALNADNLFDRKYWQAVGTRSGTNYYGSPRTVLLTLRGQY